MTPGEEVEEPHPPTSPGGAGTPISPDPGVQVPWAQSVPATWEGRKAQGSILSGIQGHLRKPKEGLVFVFSLLFPTPHFTVYIY